MIEPLSGNIQRGLDDETISVQVRDRSAVGAARRLARSMAVAVPLSEAKTEKLALVVSEAATNLLHHAERGEILLTHLRDGSAEGVEMLAVDDGPGIRELGRALRRAQPTEKGLGIGLGSIQRLSDDFAIYAPPGVGTAVMARLWRHPPDSAGQPALHVGAVSRACRGQVVCGDAWRMVRSGELTYHLMVVDGLGHGRAAAVASRAAMEALRRVEPTKSPADLMTSAHRAAMGTRGAAAMIARLRLAARQVDVCGVGNVQGALWRADGWKLLASQPGTLGIEPLKVQQFTYAIEPEDLIVIHTDGMSSRWLHREMRGLRRLHPSLLAASLYRDFGHDHDDSTVFVGRFSAQ